MCEKNREGIDMKIYCHNVRVWTRDRDKTSDWYWRKRMKRIRELIKEENPDVLCLQELSFPANLYIPREYRHVGFSASHHIYVRRGIKSRRHRFHFRWNRAEIISIDNKIFNLICVHLHWNKTILIRNMIKIDSVIRKCLKRGIPTIICGDFNVSNPNSYTNELNFIGLDYYTFHNKETGARGYIDHFATSFPLKLHTIKHRIIKETLPISDHNPLILEFTL